jgi:ribosome biogenesis GTPase A
VAEKLGDILLKEYPHLIATRYKIENIEIDANMLLEEIAKNKKLAFKNQSVDRERAGIALLNDYRQGLLGSISLETPSSRYIKNKSA